MNAEDVPDELRQNILNESVGLYTPEEVPFRLIALVLTEYDKWMRKEALAAGKRVPLPKMHYGLISKQLAKSLSDKFSRSNMAILRILSDGKRHTKAELKARSGVKDAMRRLRDVRAQLKPYGFLVVHAQVGTVHTDRLVRLRPKQTDLPKEVQQQDTQGPVTLAIQQ